jgi:uncharacterized protein
MKDILELILKHITLHPEDIVIEEGQEEGKTVFTITVNPDDMGRVIGKDGKIIRALRSIAHVIAIRQNERFRIKLTEVEDPNAPAAGTSVTDQENEPAQEEAVVEVETETEDLIAGAIDIPESTEEAPAKKPSKK